MSATQLIVKGFSGFLGFSLGLLHLRPGFGGLLFHASHAVELKTRRKARSGGNDPQRNGLVGTGWASGHASQDSFASRSNQGAAECR